MTTFLLGTAAAFVFAECLALLTFLVLARFSCEEYPYDDDM